MDIWHQKIRNDHITIFFNLIPTRWLLWLHTTSNQIFDIIFLLIKFNL